MTQAKREFTENYISRLVSEMESFSNAEPMGFDQAENDLFDLILEIRNVFSKELPEIENAILIRSGTGQRDANSVLGILKLFLVSDVDNANGQTQKGSTLVEKETNVTNKIFISHRSTDKTVADILETFLTTCGISFHDIFCSSLPGNDIKKEISKEIKESLKDSTLNIVILSSEYYRSPYCQNEAGIIWFIDVDKVVIAMPEINENLMEGFLNNEYKIRRLDNKSDILSMCDIVRKFFPEFILSHAKLNANAEKLQAQFIELLKTRTINTIAENNAENELDVRIKTNEFSDGELLILKFFYDTQKLFISDDLLDLHEWLNSNNIENLEIINAMNILVEDGLIEYCADILSRPCEFKMYIGAYRNLRKISKTSLETLDKCFRSHVIVDGEKSKSNNEVENLIIKGFTDTEILLIKYIVDLDRENLYYGWQSDNEVKMIKNWEQINSLNSQLSTHYSDAVSKMEIRKFVEAFAKTSYGNTKEFKIKETFLKCLKNLGQAATDKIKSIQSKYPIEDTSFDFDNLPF